VADVTERPLADVALAAVASRAPVVPVWCVEPRRCRLARLYTTPAGVVVELFRRREAPQAAWLPSRAGLPIAPSCRCHGAAPLEMYTESFNFMAAVVQHPHNVLEFHLERREETALALLWSDRQRIRRGVVLPSHCGLPPLIDHLEGGGRVSLHAQEHS
jgi:hypothetical protein